MRICDYLLIEQVIIRFIEYADHWAVQNSIVLYAALLLRVKDIMNVNENRYYLQTFDMSVK